MPDAENRARDSGQRREMSRGDRYAQPGVLHAHFDGDRFLFRPVHAEQLAKEEAEQEAQTVMQDNDSKNSQTGCRNFLLAARDDRCDDGDDRKGRDQRESLGPGFRRFFKQRFDNESKHNRNDHNLQNGPEQRDRVYRYPLARKQQNQCRRDDRCKQGSSRM